MTPREGESQPWAGSPRKAGENVFRLLAGHFKVKRIRTEIDLVAPNQFTGRTNPNVLECRTIVPQGENTLASQIRQVDRPGYSVVEFQFQAVTLQRFGFQDLSQRSVVPAVFYSACDRQEKPAGQRTLKSACALKPAIGLPIPPAE